MLTAWDLDRNRPTILLYGTELAGAAQIEELQRALVALAKTGMSLANPGSVTGVVNKQTVIAVLVALKDLSVSSLLKAQLFVLATDALSVLGSQVSSYLSGAADEAYAGLVKAIETAAPALTTAVRNLTQKRMGQTTTPGARADEMLEKWAKGGAMTVTPQEAAPPPHKEGVVGLLPGQTTGGSGKVGTYVAVGAAVLGLGALGWWLLK